MDWLSNWDFNEPDSLFWIFCDHGLPNESNHLIYPNSYLSWALVKDNTSNPIVPGRKVIHPTDFYATVMNKLGLTIDNEISGVCITEKLDEDRLYISEDARLTYNPLYTTNYSQIQCSKFIDGIPSRMIQATMFLPQNQISMVDYNFKISDLRNNINMNGKSMKQVLDVNTDSAYIDSYHGLSQVFL